MNCFYVSGCIVNEPSLSYMEKNPIVKFCIGVSADYSFLTDEEIDKPYYNFFQCVAFGKVAKLIVKYFEKGTKISMNAIVENYSFKDTNATPHFTQILLVNQIEYDDNPVNSYKTAPKKCNMNKVIVSEISAISEMFKEAQKKGFMLLNENDCYNLAVSNFIS